MKESNIQTIIVEYNGSYGKGDIEKVLRECNNKMYDEIPVYSRLWGEIENTAFSVLTYKHFGWDSDEGSRGRIIFKLNGSGKISARIVHHWTDCSEDYEIEDISEYTNNEDSTFSP